MTSPIYNNITHNEFKNKYAELNIASDVSHNGSKIMKHLSNIFKHMIQSYNKLYVKESNNFTRTVQ
jgi:hypothetical protein